MLMLMFCCWAPPWELGRLWAGFYMVWVMDIEKMLIPLIAGG